MILQYGLNFRIVDSLKHRPVTEIQTSIPDAQRNQQLIETPIHILFSPTYDHLIQTLPTETTRFKPYIIAHMYR